MIADGFVQLWMGCTPEDNDISDHGRLQSVLCDGIQRQLVVDRIEEDDVAGGSGGGEGGNEAEGLLVCGRYQIFWRGIPSQAEKMTRWCRTEVASTGRESGRKT